MLSKARVKFIKSLQLKKYRKQEQCFVVEGAKSVQELLRSDFEIVLLAATEEFQQRVRPEIQKSNAELLTVKSGELDGVGEFKTNDSVLAIARIKPNAQLTIKSSEFALALDDIRDPGNLGAILRTADWYGITKLILSEETADIYNSKVIHASMGSFCRVKVYYTSLPEYLEQMNVPIYGTFLEGENVHHVNFGTGGILVIGNEANGISPAVARLVTKKITIPRVGGAESLNAAIATGIICDNIRRNT